MSKRLIQDLHAGISRRDWSAVQTAANRLRDEVEQAVAILAGTGIGSLPNDYPLPQLASEAIAPSPASNVAAALVRLAEHGVPVDIQECLAHGSATLGVRPGALATALSVTPAPVPRLAALEEIKYLACTAGAPGHLPVPRALARILFLCNSAGVTKKLDDLRPLFAHTEPQT